jgi:hypothetical protein
LTSSGPSISISKFTPHMRKKPHERPRDSNSPYDPGAKDKVSRMGFRRGMKSVSACGGRGMQLMACNQEWGGEGWTVQGGL